MAFSLNDQYGHTLDPLGGDLSLWSRATVYSSQFWQNLCCLGTQLKNICPLFFNIHLTSKVFLSPQVFQFKVTSPKKSSEVWSFLQKTYLQVKFNNSNSYFTTQNLSMVSLKNYVMHSKCIIKSNYSQGQLWSPFFLSPLNHP